MKSKLSLQTLLLKWYSVLTGMLPVSFLFLICLFLFWLSLEFMLLLIGEKWINQNQTPPLECLGIYFLCLNSFRVCWYCLITIIWVMSNLVSVLCYSGDLHFWHSTLIGKNAPLILETDLVVNLASVYSRPCALASINFKTPIWF